MTTTPFILQTQTIGFITGADVGELRNYALTSLSGLRVVYNAARDAISLAPNCVPSREDAAALFALCRGAMLTAGNPHLEAELKELAFYFADVMHGLEDGNNG